MLIKAKTITGYILEGIDGEIGRVKEFYFDDQYWAIRYLVADTGYWLTERQVLISPHALVAVAKARQHITINLTKKQIEDSPSLDSDKPVSRQFETDYHDHYGWPIYWSGPYMWGYSPYMDRPYFAPPPKEERKEQKAGDPHLRSTREVTGYHIQAADGEIGHVEDFIIDEQTWAIRYLVIDTRNWWPGKKVLISPRWIQNVSWPDSKVFVNLSQETIRKSPEYSEEALLDRDYEASLHRHYNRQGYWVDELAARDSDRLDKAGVEISKNPTTKI